MTPRNPAHYGPGGRGFFGTVTVGTRGQVSIPAHTNPIAALVRNTMAGNTPPEADGGPADAAPAS